MLSYYKQDISCQEALGKAYCMQVLLMLNKLDPEITCKLFAKLALVSKTLADMLAILINKYAPLDLINQILIANKRLPLLRDKHAKAVRGNPY